MRNLPASAHNPKVTPASPSKGVLRNPFEPGTLQAEHDPEAHHTLFAQPDAPMAAPAPTLPLHPAPSSCSPITPSERADLSDEELERQIDELKLELEEREARIGVMEGHMARLDAMEATLVGMEGRLDRVLGALAEGSYKGSFEENVERGGARMWGSRPWQGSAGH